MSRRARVLVADDEPSIRFVLRETLEEEGCEVCTVEDGDEARERYKKANVGPVAAHFSVYFDSIPHYAEKLKDVPRLAFFPGMDLPLRTKLDVLERAIELFSRNYSVVPMQEHCRALQSRPLREIRVQGGASDIERRPNE